MCSLFAMLGVGLPVPDHATLSRRGKDLEVVLPKKVCGHIDIVMAPTFRTPLPQVWGIIV